MITPGMHSNAVTSDELRNEVVDYIDGRIATLQAERTRRGAMSKREEHAYSVREQTLRTIGLFMRELHLPAPAPVEPSDHDIGIGEHAFKAGYAARAAEDVGPLSDAETAWSNYTPPEELCGGAPLDFEAETRQAREDARTYGTGYLVRSRAVHPSEVTMFREAVVEFPAYGARKPLLTVFEQVYPPRIGAHQYRIVEHAVTIDGYRSRVCEKAFGNLDEAIAYITPDKPDAA